MKQTAKVIHTPSGSIPLDVRGYSNADAPKPFLRGKRHFFFIFAPWYALAASFLLKSWGILPGGVLPFIPLGVTLLTLTTMAVDVHTSRRAADSVFSRRAFLTQAYAQNYAIALSFKEESDVMKFINSTADSSQEPVKLFSRGNVGYFVAISSHKLYTYTDATGELVAL